MVRSGGELSNRKGVNRQGGGISAAALTDKDFEAIIVSAIERSSSRFLYVPASHTMTAPAP